MVEKHKLIADFEQLTYSPEMLRLEWESILDSFKMIINGGWTNRAILDFIKYIISSEHAEKFFPGTSMGTLLISKPNIGRLNYQRTLAISFDNQKSIFKLSYSDWDTIEKREDYKKAILWEQKSGIDELQMNFEEFIKWNKNWS